MVIPVALVALAPMAMGCGPGPSEEALGRFQELVARADVTYRFDMLVTSDGDRVEVHGHAVGRDSAYSTRARAEVVQPPREFIHVGDQTFERDGGGPWAVRPREGGQAGFEPPQLIVALANAPLVASGSVTFEGRTVHQLGSTTPVPLIIGGAGQVPSTLTRVEVLADDAGIPVRIVEEIAVGEGDDRDVVLVEVRFSDVGGPMSIEAPVVP